MRDPLLNSKTQNRLKVKGEKGYFMQIVTKQLQRVAILTADKLYLSQKSFTRVKEGHYILTKVLSSKII